MTDDELLQRADEAGERAYAPYSRIGVGAAILARDGAVHEGVNVENAAYPLGTCAESGALAAAVAAGCAPGDSDEAAPHQSSNVSGSRSPGARVATVPSSRR